MADNNTLLEKLDGLVSRFEEVSTLITDPNVIGDQSRYVKLTKEYKDLNNILKAREMYMSLLSGLKEAKQLMHSESDPEMREMAREEAERCEKQLPELEEKIKLLLVPADPQDDRSIASPKAGNWIFPALAKVHPAVIRRLFARSPERKFTEL